MIMQKILRLQVAQLDHQVKDLNTKLEENRESKKNIEAKFRSAEKRLKVLRDDNSELEKKIAQNDEFVTQLKTKLRTKEVELKAQQNEYRILLQHLDHWSEIRVKQVEEFGDMHANGTNVCDKMKNELIEIEKVVTGRTRMLENTYLPVVILSKLSMLCCWSVQLMRNCFRHYVRM
jgi:chromosome segregation ATPase